jgi:hypothetical protein
MLKKYLLRNQRANGTSTMLDVQLYGDGQVIYRITGKLYGYLISVVFCNQLKQQMPSDDNRCQVMKTDAK